MDKLSYGYLMSIKNAPKKWNEISKAAASCGAGEWAMRKWLERREIPASWKLKIFEATNKKITFADMEIVADRERAGV